MRKFYLIIFLLLILGHLQAQNTVPWISYPSANVTYYGVYHFRKVFSLEQVPNEMIIHVSADNRYNLFVNGKRVCYGPAKGDLKTYKYDVIDISKYLKPGNKHSGSDCIQWWKGQTTFLYFGSNGIYASF